MKKYAIVGAVAVIITVGVFSYILLSNNSVLPQDSALGVSNNTKLTPLKACNVLTKDVAKSVLSDELAETNPASSSTSTSDLSVTNCNYTTKVDTASQPPKISGISLLARSPCTQTGIDSNNQAFSGSKPDDAEDVSGIGDKSFYSTKYRQLNVLKNNNWYILMFYKDNVTNTTLDSIKAVAKKIQFK